MAKNPSMPEPAHLIVGAIASAASHLLVPVRNLIDYLARAAIAAAISLGLTWLLGYR